MVGFANRFTTLESLGAEKGGATCVLPQGLVRHVGNLRPIECLADSVELHRGSTCAVSVDAKVDQAKLGRQSLANGIRRVLRNMGGSVHQVAAVSKRC